MGHHELKPMFPVSEAESWAQKIKVAGRSPVTITTGALISLALGSSFFVPWWIGVAVTGALLGGLGLYWKKQFPLLRERVRQSLIKRSNDSQNRSLSKGEEQLRDWKCYDLADELRKFRDLKKKAETGVSQLGTVTSMSENVESLVDTLCNEVSRDLFKIADLRYTLRKRSRRLGEETKKGMKQDEGELTARISLAYEALASTVAQFQSQGAVSAESSAGDNKVLDTAIEKLKSEAELARRVRERVNETYIRELWPANTEFSSTTTSGTQGSVEFE